MKDVHKISMCFNDFLDISKQLEYQDNCRCFPSAVSTVSPQIKVTITRKDNLSSFNDIKYIQNKLNDKSYGSSDKITIYKDEYKNLSNMAHSNIIILQTTPKAEIIPKNFRRTTRGGGEMGGGLPYPFLKILKSALILEKKVLIVSILGLNLPFKM